MRWVTGVGYRWVAVGYGGWVTTGLRWVITPLTSGNGWVISGLKWVGLFPPLGGVTMPHPHAPPGSSQQKKKRRIEEN